MLNALHTSTTLLTVRLVSWLMCIYESSIYSIHPLSILPLQSCLQNLACLLGMQTCCSATWTWVCLTRICREMDGGSSMHISSYMGWDPEGDKRRQTDRQERERELRSFANSSHEQRSLQCFSAFLIEPSQAQNCTFHCSLWI